MGMEGQKYCVSRAHARGMCWRHGCLWAYIDRWMLHADRDQWWSAVLVSAAAHLAPLASHLQQEKHATQIT